MKGGGGRGALLPCCGVILSSSLLLRLSQSIEDGDEGDFVVFVRSLLVGMRDGDIGDLGGVRGMICAMAPFRNLAMLPRGNAGAPMPKILTLASR